MQIDFPIKRPRAIVGQKVDSTPSTTVSAVSDVPVAFGALVVFSEVPSLCHTPKTKEELLKPLGISLRQYYGLRYEPQTAISVLRQGRIWVEGVDATEAKIAAGEPVFIKLSEGKAIFTSKSKDAFELKGSIYLEGLVEAKVPIEINFLGGK
jgi:hypothetical protein